MPPARAFAGAAVAVAGVCLGIGTLLWASDEPAGDPVLRPAASSTDGPDAAAQPDPDDATGERTPSAPASPRPSAEPTSTAVSAEPTPSAVPTPSATQSAPPSLVVPVTVLNNSRYSGLAARAAARFEAAGWPVAETGNLNGRTTPATTVYYAAGQEASAREFARRFAGIVRVLPRYDELPGTGLTVVLTRDFAS